MDQEELRKSEEKLNELRDRANAHMKELQAEAFRMDIRFMLNYKNMKYFIIAGSVYAAFMLLTGISDFMKGRMILSSVQILLAMLILIYNFTTYLSNRAFYKSIFDEQEKIASLTDEK
jgi:hypothetical protein